MFQDWFVTESFQNIIGNKGIDGRSTLSNSSKEERKILLSLCFNEPVKKQEMYRISRIDSLFSKWDLLQTYMPWFFTSAVITLNCTIPAYLASGLLMPLPSQSHAEEFLKKQLKTSNPRPDFSLGAGIRLLSLYCTRVSAG
jgi:hypothetical protein